MGKETAILPPQRGFSKEILSLRIREARTRYSLVAISIQQIAMTSREFGNSEQHRKAAQVGITREVEKATVILEGLQSYIDKYQHFAA